MQNPVSILGVSLFSAVLTPLGFPFCFALFDTEAIGCEGMSF
jgi:hypothetical protein